METSMTESIETWKSFATRAVAVLILLTIGGTARAGTEDEVKTLFVNFVRAQNVHGKNIALLNRLVIPRPNAVEEEVVALLPNIDLLVVWGTIGGMAAKKFASSIPVVFLSVGAPVDIGLVQSLAHPGGNMTGISFEAAMETYAKRLQMLKEIIPSLSRVAVLRAQGDANVPFAMASLEKSAPTLGVTLTPIDIKTADELNTAFVEMHRSQAQALLVIAGALMYSNSKRIADLSLSYRLPSCHGFKETVADGELVSLGPDLVAMTVQAAAYIDKIARGAKPADLPVQQPTRYEVHVNLKTARALGIELPSIY
jgi:putative tryptophan/tyrosine transport system substrate-binding protein